MRTTTFTFNLTLRNDKAEDLTFTVDRRGPAGWTVDATLDRPGPGGQRTCQGRRRPRTSRSPSTPPSNAPPGSTRSRSIVTVGGQQIHEDLEVEITGSYTSRLSTPTGLLSAHGPVGQRHRADVRRSRTPARRRSPTSTMTATPPTELEGRVRPADDRDASPPGATVTVTAKITPSGDAIAGDYSITFNAPRPRRRTTRRRHPVHGRDVDRRRDPRRRADRRAPSAACGGSSDATGGAEPWRRHAHAQPGG